MKPTLAIKIDVDTELGTRVGINQLLSILTTYHIPATCYLSLGPDHTGRAIQRILRPGFYQKVTRTSVIRTYGLRTLLNGTLLPGPHIGKRHTKLLQAIKAQGFSVGIHAYDHQKWQDNVLKMQAPMIAQELQKALNEFQRIFGEPCQTAAAAGWQINAAALTAYDNAHFAYASDCRGIYPFYPKIAGHVFKTLQVPTTLPTLDELLGTLPLNTLIEHYISLLQTTYPNVLTIHAELEGMRYQDWFTAFIQALQQRGVRFISLAACAKGHAISELIQGPIQGRSGLLATQSLNHCQ